MSSEQSQWETVPGRWIVTLRPYATPDIHAAHLSLVEEKTADPTDFNVSINHKFDLSEVRGYSGAFDDATKDEIEALPEVVAVEPVQVYRHCATQKNAPWGLARISTGDKLAPHPPYVYNYTATGEGAIVYVIDTGINDKHVEFEGRASKGPKFVTSPKPISDEDHHGHGTHVSGTIASKTYGVAKKAKVVGIKVFGDDKESGAQNDDIVKALEYVEKECKRHGKPSVVNLSLGGGPSDCIDKAVASAVRSGVVVVVAAGNEGAAADTGSPSREPLAITVGATDKNDGVPKWSNWGKIVDIFAPGVDILSTWTGSPTATNTISGTSMASPHVAGAVASWLGGVKKNALLAMPELLISAEKNDLVALKPRTINALLQVSDK